MDLVIAIVVAGAVAGGFVQGLAGFSFSLVSLSVWAWAVAPPLAAPMAVAGALTGQLTTLPFLFRGFSWRLAAPFILGGLVGVPFGTLVPMWVDATVFRFLIGAFLLVYCPIMLFIVPNLRVAGGGRGADACIGLIGGVMGGIAGISGPVPTLWTTLRGWDKEKQRRTLQGFNITMHVATLTVLLVSGRLTTEHWQMFGIVAASQLLPALLGLWVFFRLRDSSFRRVVLGVLTASGGALVWGAVNQWF